MTRDIETQRRQALEAGNSLSEAAVHRDASLIDRANSQVLQMNQQQRDLVEHNLVRQGVLPDLSAVLLSNQNLFASIDRNNDRRISRDELNEFLLGQTRLPAQSRNLVNEMVLNQVAQRVGTGRIEADHVSEFARNTLANRLGYENALREYDGLAALMQRRYPDSFNAQTNRFRISAAERAVADDAASPVSFLTQPQRDALNFMIAHGDDLYRTSLGIGIGRRYFDPQELTRQAARNEVDGESVRQNQRNYREVVSALSGEGTLDYVVRRGELISEIAASQLRGNLQRDPSQADINRAIARIAQANNLEEPYRLSVEQVLRIPRDLASRAQ